MLEQVKESQRLAIEKLQKEREVQDGKITKLEDNVTKLEGHVTKLEGHVTKLEDENQAKL